MKRGLIGLTLLGALLLSGLLCSRHLYRTFAPMEQILTQAALTRDWEPTRQLHRQWQRYRSLTAAFTDHEPMDRIDSLFFQLQTAVGEGREPICADLCAQLSQALASLAREQLLTWENLL